MGSAGRRLNRQLTGGWRVLLLALYGLNGPNGLNPKCGVRCWVQRSSWNLFGCQLTGPVWTMEMTVLEHEPWQPATKEAHTQPVLLCTFRFFEGFVCSLDTPQKTVCPDWSLCHFCALLPPLFKVISDAKIHEFFLWGGPAWPVESAECARWTLTAPRGVWTLQKLCRGTEKRWFLPLCIGVIRSIRM